jgi:hypothetical protein
MKKLLLILSSCIIIMLSCNNSSGKNLGASNSKPTQLSTTSAASNKGTITCVMDGKQRTFGLQGFREIILDPYSKGPTDGVLFADGDIKKEGFQFIIKKSGATKLKTVIKGGDMNCIINYYNTQGIVYTGKDVVVNVSSYNGSKLTGTFSGSLVNVYYDGGGSKNEKNYPEFIQISKGSFDVQK